MGCKRTMDDVCIGCSLCMVGFNRREGAFGVYREMSAELVGVLGCGDCPGAAIVPRRAQMNLWNKPMGEQVTRVHVAPCIPDPCPHAETLLKKIKAKSGVEVIQGTHPYIPDSIFVS